MIVFWDIKKVSRLLWADQIIFSFLKKFFPTIHHPFNWEKSIKSIVDVPLTIALESQPTRPKHPRNFNFHWAADASMWPYFNRKKFQPFFAASFCGVSRFNLFPKRKKSFYHRWIAKEQMFVLIYPLQTNV